MLCSACVPAPFRSCILIAVNLLEEPSVCGYQDCDPTGELL